MMTFKNLRYGLSSSVVLAASLFSVLSYAATDSIGLTVITTVEMGTCTATLVNDSDQDISVVDFGDVYISEINAKTKVKTFKLKFNRGRHQWCWYRGRRRWTRFIRADAGGAGSRLRDLFRQFKTHSRWPALP